MTADARDGGLRAVLVVLLALLLTAQSSFDYAQRVGHVPAYTGAGVAGATLVPVALGDGRVRLEPAAAWPRAVREEWSRCTALLWVSSRYPAWFDDTMVDCGGGAVQGLGWRWEAAGAELVLDAGPRLELVFSRVEGVVQRPRRAP